VVAELDVVAADGRTLHTYDTAGERNGGRLAVFWHHGTPNIGAPPEPLFAAAEQRGIRWVSYDRPGYGGSSPHAGRNVASSADDVARIADALGIDRFAVMGHSGGGTHGLSCGARLRRRVLGVVCVSGIAPLKAEGLEWFAGMAMSGEADLRAAAAGRVALERHLATSDFDPEQFTPEDLSALGGSWSWLGTVAGAAMKAGPEGHIEDELAYVAPWGFDVADIAAPVLYLHGGRDRIAPKAHAQWLARRTPTAELWLRPEDGHISVLGSADAALDWLLANAQAD